MAEPITRKDTVMLMAMKIWIRSATQEKRWYLWVMICEEQRGIIRESPASSLTEGFLRPRAKEREARLLLLTAGRG